MTDRVSRTVSVGLIVEVYGTSQDDGTWRTKPVFLTGGIGQDLADFRPHLQVVTSRNTDAPAAVGGPGRRVSQPIVGRAAAKRRNGVVQPVMIGEPDDGRVFRKGRQAEEGRSGSGETRRRGN